jgi:lysophospholipase L1-like esterase
MPRRFVPAVAIAIAISAALLISSWARAQSSATTQALPPQRADVAAIKYDAKTGKPNEKFMRMHEEFVERAKRGDVDLLFLGDSITQGWNRQKEIFDEHFGKYKPANFGISGDRTQHVLWRIENGELEPPMKPKLIVLMIGTNNSNSDPADKIAAGVEKIVSTARQKTGAKVLLLAVFPRGETPQTAAKQREVIKGVNERIKKLDDGGKNVRFLDIGDKFMNADGTIPKEIMPDYLHLSKEGYERWAKAIDGPVKEMME